jgi:GldM C-terminal domain
MRLPFAISVLYVCLYCTLPVSAQEQKKFCTAQPRGSSYFYVGTENWLDINTNFIGESGDTLSVQSDSSFVSIRRTSSNHYYVQVTRRGKFNVKIKSSEDSTEFEFLAHALPNPVARIAGVSNLTSLMPEQFHVQKSLLASMKPETPNVLCIVASFDITCIRRNNSRTTLRNNGAMFNAPVRALVSTADSGDIFLFENIQSRCACDTQETKRLLDAVVVRIE